MNRLMLTSAVAIAFASTAARADAGQALAATSPQDEQVAAAPSSPSPQTEVADDTGSGIEDIVVTATKRETSLQRTPIVIDVIGGDALSQAGVVNIAAIANLAPAINFGQTNGVFTTITIRGVSSLDATELGDPAVAFNVDGEYINRPLNLAASLFDVERVEVLRGPQGTLYGRNASAGAVNIISHKPELGEFSGFATVAAGNYEQFGAQGAINIPIGSIAAIRVSGLFDRHDGYFGATVGPRLEDGNLKAGRVHLLLEPSSNLSLLVTGEYIKSSGTGPATSAVVIPAGTLPNGSVPRDVLFQPPSRDSAPGGVPDPYQKSRQKAVRAQLEWDLGFVRLSDTIAYRDTQADYFINIAGTPNFLSDYESHSSYRNFGNEIRLSNGENFPFNWQIGYYHFDEDQGPATVNLYQAASPLIKRDYAFRRLGFNYNFIEATSDAFFGEATVPIGAGFSITGGIRHTSDAKQRTGSTQSVLDTAAFNASNGATIRYNTAQLNGSVESERWTYNGVLNWQATPTNLFYTKYSTGYKSGGFTTVNTYGPEDLTSYEIGTKNRFAGGQVQLNLAGFLYDYTNQQVQTFITLPNNVQAASTINAGASRIWGIEAEFVAAITPDDRFRATVDYVNTEYTQFQGAVTSIGGATVALDLTGNRAPYAPELSIGLNYAHTFHIGDSDLRMEAVSAFKSDSFLSALNYRSQRQPAYTRSDFTVTYSPTGRQFELAAFVRNIEDGRQYRFADFSSAFGTNYFRWQFTQPRTIGARATYNF